jgi:acyl dehydratase
MNPTTHLQLNATPNNLSQYARCVIQKVTKNGKADLPNLDVVQNNVRTTQERISAYARVCGFDHNSNLLPITYAHTLAFPLHMEMMLHESFPVTPMGLVHIRNSITQHRAIRVDETMDIRCFFANGERTRRGLEFDIKTEVRIGGNLVWEGTSTNLARVAGLGVPKKAKSNTPRPALPEFTMTERWILATDLGRRYARVSGDTNPIHLHSIPAKFFGFKGHIAHGMWSKARAAAALYKKVNSEACTISVEFKLPVFLPSKVEFNYTESDDAINFDLRDDKGQKVHMKGQITKL